MAVHVQRLPRIIEYLDSYGFLQDVLNGLNVRHYNYVGEVEQIESPQNPLWCDDEIWDLVSVPFAVMVYYEGLDNEFPENVATVFVSTYKQAQEEAAWLEYRGVKPGDISIVEDYRAYKYELKHSPIR